MRTLIPKGVRLDSPRVTRILEHKHQCRLARNAMRESGLTVMEVARKADLGTTTVYRFMGLDSEDRNTREPRCSTVLRIFAVLGYDLALIQR